MTPLARPNPVVQRLPLSAHRSWQPVDGLADPASFTQGALALRYPLAAGIETDPYSKALVVVPHATRSAGQPTAEAWAVTFIQAVVEVIASDRPLTQLIRWTSRLVYADIAGRRRVVARHRTTAGVRASRQQVATVRVCQPTSRSAEVAARITFSGRSRAIAARLDYENDRWLCTAICFG
ncbi:MAG: hypothetical protein QOI51_31 [Nocardioidaceae bacterium]|nr:hypothetical protein [Nocardioidaceae bacterium]